MDGPPPSKKARLSMACNECRRRKVRCDADYPQCRNCAHRSTECFTSDPRQPDVPVIRKWIDENKPPPEATEDHLATPRAITQLSPRVPREDVTTATAMQRNHTANGGSAGGGSEVNQVSPVYHPYDMSFHSELRTSRFKMMGASSAQCLMKSLDLYLDTANIKAVSPHFQHGMRHAEEIVLPLAFTLPAFPAFDVRQTYIDAYFTRIHVLWPCLDVDETKAAIHYYATLTDLRSGPRDQIPVLASTYLIMSLGADEQGVGFTEDGAKYLQAAAELLGHVVVVPYLPAVHTLLLFTIAYRGRNKDGLGWQTIGQAIRIGQTLGLHRHSAIMPSNQHGVTHRKDQLYHARIWGVCCCLEKMIQLESGRPSSVVTVNRDQMMGQAQRAPGHDFLQWNMALAEYQGEISQHIYGHKPGERTAQEILLNTARLDTAFMAWAKELPHQFQPTSALFCSKEDLHFAAFLSVQFHQSMIALHRAALIAPRTAFDSEVERYCAKEPSKYRLIQGELICAESARTIIRLGMEVQENKADSRVLTPGPVLLACVVLAISLVKNPRGKMQAMDLELLKAGVELTNDHYLDSGQDPRFCQGVMTILDRVRQYFRHKPDGAKRPRDLIPGVARPHSEQIGRIPSHDRPSSWLESTDQLPMGPPPTYHTAAATTAASSQRPFPKHQYSNGGIESPSNVPSETQFGTDASWNQLPPRADDLSDSLLSGHGQEPDARGDGSRMPFDDYNAEELWNWMYFMDSEEGSQMLMQQSL